MHPELLSVQTPDQVVVGISSVQNRQGYCSCCQVHYSILDQHLLSAQHRCFANCCRCPTGSNILMHRFLQDVRKYHPQLYHDNRPTYDDMPDVLSLPTPKEDSCDNCLLPGDETKDTSEIEGEKRTLDSEFATELCRSKGPFMPFIQKPRPTTQICHQKQCMCRSIKNCIPLDNIATSSHEALFSAVSPLPHNSRSVPLAFSSSSPKIANNAFSAGRLDQTKQRICINQENRYKSPSFIGVSPLYHLKTPSLLLQRTAVDPEVSSLTNLSLSSWTHGLKSQGETRASELHLKNLVSSYSDEAQQYIGEDDRSKSKEARCSKINLTSVDEIIEDVILKYCYGISPMKLSSSDEGSSSLNFQSLLEHSKTVDSDTSFDLNVPVHSGVNHSKAFIKEIDCLQEIHVTLQDDNYESQLSSVLKAYPVKKEEGKQEDNSKEVVIQPLPHVPPSFVGKTWSQIMYEDDLKVNALVQEFKEGHFRSYFDSESLTNCSGKSNKTQKVERNNEPLKNNRTENAPIKALSPVSDHVNDDADSYSPPSTSNTLCKLSSVKNPGKRTWRLASRCQIVKVSHGTQTNIVNCPLIKRKLVRKEQEPVSEKATFDWLENERTPEMRTRLCALKLPESYRKFLRPIQPNSVVYVLSCPEMKPCNGKPAVIQKTGQHQHHSTDKCSIRYKYKPCPLKYYDPLTNRVLKTVPRSSVRRKGKKAPCARQLFRNLNINFNMKEVGDGQKESSLSMKSVSLSDLSSSSSAPLLADITKGKDFSSSLRLGGSADSTEESKLAQSEVKSCRHLILPLDHSQWGRDIPLKSPNNIKRPKKNLLLEKGNSKVSKKKKGGSKRQPDISNKSSGILRIPCTVTRSRRKKALEKEDCRTRRITKAQINKSSGQKFSVSSVQGCQTRHMTVGKRFAKKQPDTKKVRG
ncbi:DBF4-type zinc finger-containing protein 2 isoform X2 [Microcaecilia unicolor]|uniref:DBF4-type zinc finger-containing protein 2 isoform X2 n=1 Tax=Microcaecilia unicolor TaxID=1415580 RepID=A0A6P7YJF8_9AMPH|nr:DBF4-type zinc finger-containing protein 2 isoform X2 [Microcaecilia unicolor]